MTGFDAKRDIINSQLILDGGEWPNFHDAEIDTLTIWRGDVRPEENIWIGPILTASFVLCALEKPYQVILRFYDCEKIELVQFDNQNAIYDLSFKYESRGRTEQGMVLTPYIVVSFKQAFNNVLSFKCFRIEAIEKLEIE